MMATSMNVDVPELQVTEVGEIKYFEKKLLGKGNFGCVYEGLLNEERVAVKRILRERYEEIEEKLMTISHLNILRYLVILKDKNFVYIAMELCAGTLEDLIRNKYQGAKPGPMEMLLLQTARGLQFLHDSRIIHRDIKPINILISVASCNDLPVMKLADFGLCKQRTDDASSFTNSAFGTPGWAAPEAMMTDVQRITFSADIFSLGCVFGYALTGGCHPFGDNRRLREHNVINKSINWPNERLIKKQEIKKTIRRMISHDPRQRPTLSIVIQLLKTQQIHFCAKSSEQQPALLNEVLQRMKTCVDDQCDLSMTDEYGRNCVMALLDHRNYTFNDVDDFGKFQKRCLKIFFSDAAIPLIDMNHKDKRGRNVLHYLCEDYRGDDIIQFAELLINLGNNVNEASSDGTPLHLLVSYYDGADICNVMQLLIDAGADVNVKGPSYRNALLHLCYFNSSHPMLKEATAVLIKSGVDINHVDANGWNALMIVCSRKQVANAQEVVKFLLENGIDFTFGNDALLVLCENYKGYDLVNILETLVEKGADINSKTDRGENALHIVCQNYQNPRLTDVIEYLIEKGIDVNAKDEKGHDALYYLRKRSSPTDPLELQRLEEAINGKK